MKPKKHKSRFSDPGGGYRAHTQVHKAKNKYDRSSENNEVSKMILEEEE